MIVVDAANVVGSRPDGWWRDRAGAAAKLHSRLVDAVAAGRLDAPVVLVLEGKARPGVDEGDEAGIRVVHAAHEGDDTIVDVVAHAAEDSVRVVTADRGLRTRVEGLGAEIIGPGWLLDLLEAPAPD